MITATKTPARPSRSPRPRRGTPGNSEEAVQRRPLVRIGEDKDVVVGRKGGVGGDGEQVPVANDEADPCVLPARKLGDRGALGSRAGLDVIAVQPLRFLAEPDAE